MKTGPLSGTRTHTALGQLLHQAAQIIEVSCQAIHAVHHHGVAFANETEHGLQLGTLGVLARGFVGEQLADLDLFKLAFRVLVEAANPDIADTVSLQKAVGERSISAVPRLHSQNQDAKACRYRH